MTPPGSQDGPVRAIDHVQLAMPPDQEDAARAFYAGLLGLSETPKPPDLVNRGGCWFERNGVRLHLGVDQGFGPAKKAHVALTVAPFAPFLARAASAGAPVETIVHPHGLRQTYVEDPFGNRIEIIDAEATAPPI